jgi:hypothetical protein
MVCNIGSRYGSCVHEGADVEFDRLVSRFEYKSSRLEYWQLGSDSYCGPLTEVDHR